MSYSYDPQKVNLSVVAAKSLGLGVIILTNITLLAFNTFPALSPIHVFISFVCVFHFLEFLSTCLFNNSATDDDSFILTDTDLHVVYVLSIIEFFVERYFGVPRLQVIGLIVTIIGQTTRTLAMYTARESFNHYIQKDKEEHHVLVTNGIYSFIRHPSYFGYFWWFVGLELWLGNYIVLALGVYKLWWFFKKRISYEEEFLVRFFKQDYIDYRKKVPTLMGI